METENQEINATTTASNSQFDDMEVTDSEEILISELNQPIWAIVNFEKCEINDLSYAEAVQKLIELEKKGVFGLCLVTNDAAQRVKI